METSHMMLMSFQHKLETVSVTVNLEDAHETVDFAVVIVGKQECAVKPWLVNWIGAALV